MNKAKKVHTIWAEKYRPTVLDEYIGNEHLKQKTSIYLESGDVPHLLLYGKAGTGKSTLAKIIKDNIECDHLYINASDKGGVDFIRNEIIPFASTIGFKPLKIVILDEADFLTPNAQAALRHTMEQFSKKTRFILTCNYVEKIIDPIQSRCQVFEVIPPSRKEVALRVNQILASEKIDFNLEDLAVIVNADYPDVRRIINSCQRQIVDGKLKIDEQSLIESNYQLKLLERLTSSKDGPSTFKEIRQLVADSKVRDFNDAFKFLFDHVDDFAEEHQAPVILTIAESQYTDSFVVDKEINFMSCIIKILNEIK